MATYLPSSSMFIDVLRLFRSRIRAGSAWTVEEIWQALQNDYPRRYWDYEFAFYRRYQFFGRDFDNPLQWLTAVLEDLAELDLVTPADSPEESSGFPLWRVGDSWRPLEPPSGGGVGGGGGGRVGPAADGGDGDEEGGGGLREALGHPVLLALSQDDFDELVAGLFEEVQP